jgi:hypothetical protein
LNITGSFLDGYVHLIYAEGTNSSTHFFQCWNNECIWWFHFAEEDFFFAAIEIEDYITNTSGIYGIVLGSVFVLAFG